MNSEQLRDMAISALEDVKADNITILDVREKTDVCDYMVIASGTSNRHTRSLGINLSAEMKKADMMPRVEGEEDGEWVLVDLGDVLVHIMLPEARERYDIESLWSAASRD
ncbi:ribosome silencing factor [Pelagibaculum spongiae]|uniref:Ribosomal silencing factor RsfS n=1 Tax=Pelagibaculum spongiae TaxID=2080658 RepID=A0A2V1GYF3_9GAMM|nr:ribosome silencing factor [Pelagibaculum spongiae]PVZ72104.1 ribosome silencing factor [Pelagibaculum spongiae]